MDPKITLGENIRRCRLFRGLEQKDLAAKTGLSVQTISKIETGTENVSFESLIAIAGALDAALEELVSEDCDKRVLKIVLSKENAIAIRKALVELGKVLMS